MARSPQRSPAPVSQWGRAERGMKMPQMKVSGRTMASTIGLAASTLWMKVASVKPRQQKAAAPTATSRAETAVVWLGRGAP